MSKRTSKTESMPVPHRAAPLDAEAAEHETAPSSSRAAGHASGGPPDGPPPPPTLAATASPPPDDDPFDPDRLRLSQDFASAVGVRKLLTTVPVRKPSNEWWVRTHTDPAYRLPTAVLELKEDREIYLVNNPELGRSWPRSRRSAPGCWSRPLPARMSFSFGRSSSPAPTAR